MMNQLDHLPTLQGEVLIEQTDEDGNVLSVSRHNAITYLLRNQIVNALVGKAFIRPTHLAVGVIAASSMGVATGATTSTLTDLTKVWALNEHRGYVVETLLGTGSGQVRSITSNTATELTVSPVWAVQLDATTRYRIVEAKDVRTRTKLPREIDRKLLEDIRADADACTVLGIFRKNEAGGDWTHAMLVDQAAGTVVVDNCDVITNWDAPGAGSALSLDTTTRQVGTGSIKVDITGTAAGTVVLRNDDYVINASALGETTTEMTFWLYISDAAKISGSLTVELSSSPTNDLEEWQWSVAVSEVTTGWNFIRLRLLDAAKTGVPTLTDLNRVRISIPYVANSNGTIIRLDRIWLFQAAGSPLAIVEFNPTFTKAVDSIVNIRWSLKLVFNQGRNVMLWNAQDTEAVVNDVTQDLIQTGVGTFPTVPVGDPHPWRWPKMWLPAASGYMTAGSGGMSPKKGSIAMWYRFDTVTPTISSILLNWQFNASNRLVVQRFSTSWQFVYLKNGTGVSTFQTDAFVASDYRLLVVTWDSQLLRISISDSDNASATAFSQATMSASQLMETLPDPVTIGGGPGLVTTNTPIGPVLFFNNTLSYAEVDNLFKLARAYFYRES